ncbi:hypothetical protein HPG69_000168, partial [Diceros bicornis minor]
CTGGHSGGSVEGAEKTTDQPGAALLLDIASRGLDSTHVELVVNYDFSLTLQDRFHRAERSEVPGTVISFVTHPWGVSLVQKIELAVCQRRGLPGLGSSVREPLSQQT